MEFQNAPIAEVVIGIQFDKPLISYNNILNFYQTIKTNFVKVKEQQVLSSAIENPNGQTERRLLQGFNSRKLFINKDENKLVQIQPDRLLFNWRKTNDTDEYPHFSNVYHEFKNIYEKLSEICSFENKDNQLEVAYVDHIIIDEFGKNDFNPSEILSIFNIDKKKTVNSIEQNITFPVKNLLGNINLQIVSATRNNDKRKIFRMESTCRGARKNEPMDNWYENAHNELLKLFSNITTEKAKQVWGIIK